ncbi:MAG: type I-E CRISPR-associated endoribonuclease Cas2 [Bacillota bacterium]
MLEPKAGVFVGTVSAAVRDLLWEKACKEIEEGGVLASSSRSSAT